MAVLVRQARLRGKFAHIDPAAVFVIGEVAHIVQAVLNLPVVAHRGYKLVRSGPLGRQRGKRKGHFGAGLAGLEQIAFALNPDRLAPAVQLGIVLPARVADVLDPVAAAVDAAMLLVEGFPSGAGATRSTIRRTPLKPLADKSRDRWHFRADPAWSRSSCGVTSSRPSLGYESRPGKIIRIWETALQG